MVQGNPQRLSRPAHGACRRLVTRVASALASVLLATVGLTGAGGVVAAAHASAATTGVLYAPNISANPNEDASYPRVIRLAHSGSANGELLSTFSHSGVGSSKGSFPIYQSNDDGHTWSSAPIGTVTDTVHGWDLDGPTLYELPGRGLAARRDVAGLGHGVEPQ